MSSYLNELKQDIWAMEPRRLEALLAKAEELNGQIPNVEARDRLSKTELKGSTAYISVKGALMKSVPRWMSYWGIDATSYQDIKTDIEAAVLDKRVESIVLDIESPGGQVAGIHDAADAIFEARKTKPVKAYIEDLCASAAYWLAAQADEIVASQDAMVGSIGVYSVHIDSSARAEKQGFKVHVVRSGDHKGMGIPGDEITEGQIASAQRIVDGLAESFMSAVGRGRGLERADVQLRATGEVWLAQRAVELGLVDRVSSRSTAFKSSSNNRAKAVHKKEFAMSEQQENDGALALEKYRAEERKRTESIRAAFSDDPAFAMDQITAGSSLIEAKAAYADKLIEDRKAEREQHKAQLAEKEEALAQAKASAELSRSNPPIAAANANSALVAGGGGGFVAQAKVMAREQGCSLRAAMSAISKTQPDLHAEFVTASREIGKKQGKTRA